MVRKATTFEFVEYKADWETGELEFRYKIMFEDGLSEEFAERLILPIDSGQARMTKDDVIDKVLQNLHFILGISYYKLYCPKEIQIKPFSLTQNQAEFWNIVYTKGLGEFFYKNKIDYRGLVKFPFDETKQILKQVQDDTGGLSAHTNRALVAIGGGKDSIVTAEILKKNKVDFTAFTLQNHKIQKEVIDTLGVQSIQVTRTLDPKLFELNKTGDVYNGHIPISAIYAFISLLIGVLYNYKYLIFSNERSSNYGNIDYLGSEINHQWSKSEEFELLFQSFIHENVTPDVTYFSLLRPLYEIEIVRRFADMPQYHTIFSSCNRNFKYPLSFRIRQLADEKSQSVKDERDLSPDLVGIEMTEKNSKKLWCGKCAKCAFVFCLLSAFFSKDKVIEIFGNNLYENDYLVTTYKELLGLSEVKPFDCVGTPEETKVAMNMAYQKGEYKDSKIMQLFESDVLPTLDDIEALQQKLFTIYQSQNMPDLFKKMI